jgi:hypothetical protein
MKIILDLNWFKNIRVFKNRLKVQQSKLLNIK